MGDQSRVRTATKSWVGSSRARANSRGGCAPSTGRTSDLGPPGRWPENLRTAVSLCLTSRFPILIWWGPDLNVLYNDAYIPFLGRAKHPSSLGRPGREVWAEIWDTIGPMLEGVRRTGAATWSDDFLSFFERDLPREEVHVRFTYGPILAADGRTVEGVFCPCTEITDEVVGARRLETLRKLGVKSPESRSVRAACAEAARVLSGDPHDIPFAAIYVADEAGDGASLVASAGLPEDHPLPPWASLAAGDDTPWPLAAVLRTGRAEEVRDLRRLAGPLPGSPWPEPPSRAVVLPVPAPNHGGLAGLLALGVSPRRVWDAPYRAFFDLVAGHIGTALADARAHEAERRRAEALAEIDRAKTAFFSNVSHEFRTPLTLMLGPVEDALADADEPLPPGQRERLETAHRNGLRLLKLVNTLLDFSRIEAGRVQASYEPTDLAALTAELASIFRSACEKAGLRLVVDCPPLPEPVFVDRDMWEKVVLNLVSNAFKFTLEGEIVVRLGPVGGAVELSVRDTGTGIPAGELPRIFERFHRVEGRAAGRTRGPASAWPWSRSWSGSTAARCGRRAPSDGAARSSCRSPWATPTCPPIRSGRPARRRPPRWGRPPSSRRRSAGCPMRRPPARPRAPPGTHARRPRRPTRPRSRRARTPPPREGTRAVLGSSGPTTTRTCATTSAGCWNRGTTWRPCRTARRPWPRPGRARRTWCSPT